MNDGWGGRAVGWLVGDEGEVYGSDKVEPRPRHGGKVRSHEDVHTSGPLTSSIFFSNEHSSRELRWEVLQFNASQLLSTLYAMILACFVHPCMDARSQNRKMLFR